MKPYLQGLLTGSTFSILIIVFIAATKQKTEVGRYEYYISNDDITLKHYARIFDSATGIVYHKTFSPGGEKVDINWVNGERIERRHFRPDISVWRSESFEEYKIAYEKNRGQK